MDLFLGFVILVAVFLGAYFYGVRVGARAGYKAGHAAGENQAVGRLLENGMIDGPVPFMGHVL